MGSRSTAIVPLSMLVSIFNDVIGPVMRGPSSSHCAAALRIGRLGRDLMGGEIDEVLVEFDVHGSLPTTHDTQGSDMGLFGGLLGWEADDDRLPDSMRIIQEGGVKVRIETVDVHDEHPNTYRLTLKNARGSHFLKAISTGGGMMEVIEIDGVTVSLHGDAHVVLAWSDLSTSALADALAPVVADTIRCQPVGSGSLAILADLRPIAEAPLATMLAKGQLRALRRLSPVLPVLSSRSSHVPFSTCAELLAVHAKAPAPLWKHAVAYEAARGGLTEAEVVAKMVALVCILRRSIAQGLAGTHYEDRVLGFQSGGFARELAAGRLLDAGSLNRGIMYVTAMMEVKSSMGVIIAMPTAGACAALPGIVIALAEDRKQSDEDVARALLAAGLIGVFIATAWTFAAEVGGCQAEGGSAAAMAGAALVTLSGGDTLQACAAASMAMQSMIGLICDPIANRVEAPCLGKNVMAAANALSCANMALSGFDQVIPFDEVIATAKRVSAQMPRELRCTALGGLSITPTSLALEQRLLAKRGCGTGSCGCG